MDHTTKYYAYHIATNKDISEYLSPADLRQDELPGPVRRREPAFIGRGACTGYATPRRSITDGIGEIANEGIDTPDRLSRQDNASEETTESELDGCMQSTHVNDGNNSTRRETGSQVNRRTPWKVIAFHTGTKRDHYHLIYFSTNKNWGYNSKLGKIIKSGQFMCRKITCIPHIFEYISTGPNRKTLRNLLSESDKRLIKCAACQLGIQIGQAQNPTRDPEGGVPVLREQSAAQDQDDAGMAESDSETGQDISQMEPRTSMGGEQRELDFTIQPSTSGNRRLSSVNRSNRINEQNRELVLLLCNNRAFSEGDAQRVLCQSPEGIAIQFIKNFSERLKTAISISRILVFCESAEKRLERAKQYYLREFPNANDPVEIDNSVGRLRTLLTLNNIYHYEFAVSTRKHFYGQTNKRNNLFFYGPPSTGKTMVMESLVYMHYNFERLTGLTPSSPFNFSSLQHANACFMDECKLTENQFEQWKLLAAGTPMPTDVKYKNRHNVSDCVLYTASNYRIGQYIMVGDVEDAIATRTIEFRFNHIPAEYFKISPWTWEKFWEIETIEDDFQIY